MQIAYRKTTRMVLTAVIALALLAVASFAQSITIQKIVINGTQRVERATVLSYAGIKVGQTVTPGEINAAGQRLRDSGLFESVKIDPRGTTIVITVVELPTINKISIEGNKRLDDKVLMKVIQSEPRRVFSAKQAEADAAAIANAYAQSGRIAATVVPKIIRRSENRVDLVFEVTEGRVIEVQRIAFVGNRAYSDNRLRKVISTKQAGLLHAFVQSDTYMQDRIAYDKQQLTDFYHSRGYIDFEITSVSTQLTRARDAFLVTFNLREGQKFRFGKITVTSEVPEISAAGFAKQVRIKPGVTYNPTLVDGTVNRLENLATKEALSFVRVEPKVTRNEQTRTLDINFALVRGQRVFIERIDIEGNATTLDRVIRREFHVVEGDPFNPREIGQAADRLRALGFFKTVKITTRQGSSPDKVIITVHVEEQPTGSLSFGASYSPDTGIGGVIKFSEKNFLGRGQELSFSIQSGSGATTNTGSFTEPYFLGRNVQFSASYSLGTTNTVNSTFSTRKAGGTVSLSFPLATYSRLTTSYSLTEDTVSNVPADSSPIIQAEEGSKYTSALGYAYRYDTRGRGLDPTRGVELRFQQQAAGLGGDNRYLLTTGLAGGEMKVLNEEVTLSAVAEAGALQMFQGNSRVTDRFLATSRYVRGFAPNGYGPRDLNAGAQDALGGNYYASFRLEAQFPLGIPPEYGLSGGVFADLGSVWGLNNTDGAAGPDSVDDSLHWRSSVGLSIFWTTPIGPLRFNFPHALMKQSYDRTQTFEFTVQTRF